MNPIRSAIIDILTQNPDGLTQSQIRDFLIDRGIYDADVDNAAVFYHLNNVNNGLIARGWVQRDETHGEPYTYHLLNEVLPQISMLETNDPAEFDANIGGMINENGFDEFCERISFGSGSGSKIVVIPGSGNPPCSEKIIVLANHQGAACGECWSELDRVVTILKARMICCIHKTKLVQIVTDRWDASEFNQRHASELRAFQNCHNVQIKLRVISSDRHQSGLVPI